MGCGVVGGVVVGESVNKNGCRQQKYQKEAGVIYTLAIFVENIYFL